MTVRKIKAKLVLRLRADGLTGRQIALQGMSRHSVAAVIDAADRGSAGSTWPRRCRSSSTGSSAMGSWS